MRVDYTPPLPLGRFVRFWYSDAAAARDERVRVLPTGTLSLVVNLDEDEVRWYPGAAPTHCQRTPGAAVGGAYAEHFAIDTREQRQLIGARFLPGGAGPFFPVPLDELTGTHVALDLLWGRDGAVLRERILEAPTVRARLAVLELALLERLVRPLVRDPALDHALDALDHSTVAEVVDALGMTAQRFIRRFSASVGLTPKRHARVRRFQRALGELDRRDLAELAVECGYADQAHFNHEFQAFAGVTPTVYRAHRRARNQLRMT